ncbi:uncharacterized protein LOC126677089 [Mercurialis annua]|uniref:uncharacterized protein LOC126677089 n=1 Tax=Mercurialis annua TaxID=3986 RepID=UPI00215EEFAE|nr:uncharacterized protein LOC126677089 [Mercurialis annua]XP_050227498.1 uncharacterized protein LOC126677089 [Mercurialis annua]
MQGGRGRGGPFFGFGDPFGGFGGGFEDQSSLFSNLMGGNPFNDPFFAPPFGGMMGSSFFGSNASPFSPMHPSPFMEHQAIEPPRRSRGPIIEELNSDDEKEETDNGKKDNPRKHGRPDKEPYVEDPDDEAQERKSKHVQYRNSHNRFNGNERLLQPQTQSFTFQSSTVTYGGADGAYYTSSKTRRSGSDGVTIEESKEADSIAREASHRISRGLHNKGHTVARKLNSDGKVDTMQTLHNLHEDELTGFEEAWKGKARHSLPGWDGNFSGHDNMRNAGSGQASQGGWALPSTEQNQQSRTVPDNGRDRVAFSQMQNSGRTKASSNVNDKSGNFRGKARK